MNIKIAVILGSTRKVRRGEKVAQWVMSQVEQFSDVDFVLLDLCDYPLPFYEEDSSPDSLEHGYTNPVATEWARKIGEADAFIIITPEYNHAPPAVLKNALDYVYNEWNKKPVGFISYSGGAAAGIRAVEQLREIAVELEMAPIQAAVHMGRVTKVFDENGVILEEYYNKQFISLVKQLLWWAKALKIAREITN